MFFICRFHKKTSMQTPEPWTFPRVWAGFVLALIGVTYPLWFPIGDGSIYPLLSLVDLGKPIALLASVTLIGSLIVAVLPGNPRWSWSIVAGSLFVSFLVDQHRIQPWAYQTAIYAVVIAALPAQLARSWLIPVAASVYIYSALGKFDYQFAHTVGQDFLNTLASPIDGLPAEWDASQRAKVALLFPIGELAIGVGLLLPITRRFAAPAAMLMHGSLLAILGPWGLGHSTGVLVWNAALVVQAYLLMIQSAPEAAGQPRSKFAPVAYGFVVIALLAPLSERFGYWDHWTSWALYSPHNSRVDVEIHKSAIEQLPKQLQDFIDTDPDTDHWHALNLGHWSLSVRRVPVYPQARYQLELSNKLADQYHLQDAIRLRQRSISDRWTGERAEHLWLGQRQIERGLKQYWLTN
jgi:hypothetical protein